MCLAIYKPADTAPDWKSYENGHDDNPHSWGFAAVKDGRVMTAWGLGKFEEFREAFEPFADCKAIIHFRWATHGGKTLDNCHPFMVSDNLAMIHNGIISIKCNVNTSKSDTWHFNELVLKPMHDRDPDFFLRPEVRYSQQLAHKGSKFCFLRADGMHEIWCEDDGLWEKDGHWYSNSGYRSSRKSYYFGSSCSTALSQTPKHGDMSPAMSDSDTSVMTTRDIEIDLDAEEYDLMCQEREADPLRDPYSDELEYDSVEFMAQSLMSVGFSSATLKEIYDILGTWGIEVLHDAI